MKQTHPIVTLFYFILFFAIQVLLFRNVSIFNLAFCFFYVGFILLIPQDYPVLVTLLISFALGFVVDFFYDTMGIHMASCVLIGYLRPFIIQFLTPRGGYDANSDLSIPYMGLQWFVTYAAVLIFIHHFVLFLIESWGFGIMFRLFAKTFLSTLFTLFVVILFQYLLTPAKKQ